MRRLLLVFAAAAALLVLLAPACDSESPPEAAYGGESPPEETADSETDEGAFEGFDPRNFDGSTNIDNEWWPQNPGTQFVYEGSSIEDGERVPHRVVFTVTDLTKVIAGVRTVVSMEVDYSGDELVESELAFHAQDKQGNVWHLGQYRETYDEVEFVGGRVWVAGIPEGAKAGIRMEAEPRLGTPGYSQGYAPAPFHWTDSARVYQMGQEITGPSGSYEDVLVMEEWDEETEEGIFQLKYYARGVGVVRVGWRGDDPEQEELDLVAVVQLSPEELANVREVALEHEKRALMYGLMPPAERE